MYQMSHSNYGYVPGHPEYWSDSQPERKQISFRILTFPVKMCAFRHAKVYLIKTLG
jgi:hypothetical protein